MLAGLIQCLPSLQEEVPHLAHARLLLVIQVAYVFLCYAGLSCQYAIFYSVLLLLQVVLPHVTAVS